MRGLVLAAGRGTRLAPLTDHRAKPACPVGHGPMLRFALHALVRAGVREIVVNARAHPETIEAAVAEVTTTLDAKVDVRREPAGLGTAGALVAHRAALDDGDGLVVFNGDVMFAPDLGAAIAHHRRSGALATMLVQPAAGNVATAGGRVRALRDLEGHESDRKVTFTGVQVLSPEALANVASPGCLVELGYQRWLRAGEHVAAFEDLSPWSDLGTPARYLEACLAPLDGRSGVHPSAFVDPRARLVSCTIGARTRVVGPVELRRVVAWPDADVTESASDTVLTPSICVRTTVT